MPNSPLPDEVKASQPLSNIEWKHVDDLQGNDWNPNVVFTPEFKLLEQSLLASGWIQPVLCNSNGIIIDGFHRTGLSRDSKAVRAKYDGWVPCVVMDLEDHQAMILTVRMNRAKGSHSGGQMSKIIKRLIDDYGYSEQMLRKELGMTQKEIALLHSDSIWQQRNLSNRAYSQAWVPKDDKLTEKEIPDDDPIYAD